MSDQRPSPDAPAPPPPAPGPVVLPNVSVIEDALRDVTFPISKRELMADITEDETVVLEGRNVELRTLVRDLDDDCFESEDEFREALETSIGDRANGAEALLLPFPPAGFPESMPMDAPGAAEQPAVPDDSA